MVMMVKIIVIIWLWHIRPEYEDIEDGKKGEGDEVEEYEVHPGDVDLNVIRILAQKFFISPDDDADADDRDDDDEEEEEEEEKEEEKHLSQWSTHHLSQVPPENFKEKSQIIKSSFVFV